MRARRAWTISESVTGTSVKEATRHAIKMDVRQAKWAEVQYITTLMPVEKRRKRFLGAEDEGNGLEERTCGCEGD